MIMKQKYLYYILFFILFSLSAQAQIQIQNGGFELWSGTNIQHPDNWTTLEEAIGVKKSRWTFRETIPESMHSGLNAVQLFSDTISVRSGLPATLADSPTQVILWPGILTYGYAKYINNKIESTGVPIHGRPTSVSMYVKIYHPVPDTARLRVLLTRWNNYTHQQDTLAYERRDIFPDSSIMNRFAYYIDSINYLMDGQADTVRVIISGGQRANLLLQGNTVWIDDVKFNYPNDQVVHTNIEDEVFLYPNPATVKIHIDAHSNLAGYTIVFQDVSGVKVKEVVLDEGATTIPIDDMKDGSYTYAILDLNKYRLHEGNINVMRDR
jgi:hypothetical protein